MSTYAASSSPIAPTAKPAKSFVAHAKLIGLLTLLSRILGMARESVSAKYFGAGLVSSAFIVAFSIPNLFRKLFGEGALSAAFIPLYTKALKADVGSALADGTLPRGTIPSAKADPTTANDFAAASVNLLCVMLLIITAIGELVIWLTCHFARHIRLDQLLTLKFTAIMLPYVLLICGTAFLSSILQVHRRFGLPAFAPVILNIIHITVIVLGARFLHLQIKPRQKEFDPLTVAGQTTLAYWLCFFVLVAGVLQVGLLMPALRQVGFRLKWVPHFWTPPVKQMLKMSIPVALGAGVLQISVLMDKALSLMLAQSADKFDHLIDTFHFFGHTVRYPMELGAAARLNWAQFLYQFPLGVFAIALATAIFPGLSADALDRDRASFKAVLRQGIEATMFEGLAASIGLMIVALPAAKLLFQHGGMTAHDSQLIARSVIFYSSAIWAFSLLQITNRAYYALHDTKTPLVMAIMNIAINLIVELPLIWLPGIGEAGMAVGTCVSFAIQAVIMLWILDRRIGGLELRRSAPSIIKMLGAALVMGGVCLAVQQSPIYPRTESKTAWALQLAIVMSTGAVVYLGICSAMGIEVLHHMLPKRFRGRRETISN
jgi:putative peptidoglycan lipid II flippase